MTDNVRIKVTLRLVRATVVTVEKQLVFHILNVDLLILVIQHVQCMRRIMSYVASLVLPYFPHCIINGTIFGKPLLKIKRFFLFSLQILSETFLILRRIQIELYTLLHVK